MRMIVSFAALASLALAACGVTPTPAPLPTPPTAVEAAPVPVAPSKVQALTAGAMYAAEAAYNVPAHAYVTANERGLLPEPLKRQVQPLLVAAYEQLKKARLFYAVGDAVGFFAARAELETNADQANRLIPK